MQEQNSSNTLASYVSFTEGAAITGENGIIVIMTNTFYIPDNFNNNDKTTTDINSIPDAKMEPEEIHHEIIHSPGFITKLTETKEPVSDSNSVDADTITPGIGNIYYTDHGGYIECNACYSRSYQTICTGHNNYYFGCCTKGCCIGKCDSITCAMCKGCTKCILCKQCICAPSLVKRKLVIRKEEYIARREHQRFHDYFEAAILSLRQEYQNEFNKWKKDMKRVIHGT